MNFHPSIAYTPDLFNQVNGERDCTPVAQPPQINCGRQPAYINELAQ